MDKFTDPMIEQIILCFVAQIGKTEAELNMIGYALDQTQSPVMMVYPTDTIAKFASDKRVQPMIKSVKSISDNFDENSRGEILYLINTLFSFTPENCGNKSKKNNITQTKRKE